MIKQGVVRLLIFAIIVGGMILGLNRYAGKHPRTSGETLSSQIDEIVEKVKDFSDEKVLGTIDNFVPGSDDWQESVSENV